MLSTVVALTSFSGAPVARSVTRAAGVAMETREDLKALAVKCNPTVGYFRHAEIKHGRVAMAAFVGFCVQSNGIHFPWDIKGGILGDAATALSYGDLSAIPAPVDQWAAVPTAGKLQILGTIAVLEFVGETMEPHYMRGGKPGFYPSLKDAAGGGKGNIPHPVPLDLYDPFGFFEGDSEEKKARGRNVEINNGRAAMLGIFGLICASKGLIVP